MAGERVRHGFVTNVELHALSLWQDGRAGDQSSSQVSGKSSAGV
jgi:hypothetical protein